MKDKLEINNLVNVPTSLNNLKTKFDNLHVGKLKTVSTDWKKLSDIKNLDVLMRLL